MRRRYNVLTEAQWIVWGQRLIFTFHIIRPSERVASLLIAVAYLRRGLEEPHRRGGETHSSKGNASGCGFGVQRPAYPIAVKSNLATGTVKGGGDSSEAAGERVRAFP